LIAFDIGGDRKITPKLFNYSTTGAETTLGIYRGSTLSESISMEKIVLEVASDEYNYYTWALNNGAFNRTEIWLDRIDEENLFIYRTVIEVERYQTISLKSGSTTMYCTYLSEVLAPDGTIGMERTNNRIRFNTAGKYVVEYLPFCEVINIYEYIEETPDPDTPDPEGIVIEINGEKFAMNFETYPSDEKTSYVYGYVYINAGDKLLIRDTESGAVWGERLIIGSKGQIFHQRMGPVFSCFPVFPCSAHPASIAQSSNREIHLSKRDFFIFNTVFSSQSCLRLRRRHAAGTVAGGTYAVAAAAGKCGRGVGQKFQHIGVELFQDLFIGRIAAGEDDLVIRCHAGKSVHSVCPHDLLHSGAFHENKRIPVQVQILCVRSPRAECVQHCCHTAVIRAELGIHGLCLRGEVDVIYSECFHYFFPFQNVVCSTILVTVKSLIVLQY
jgi:hypothetical protein